MASNNEESDIDDAVSSGNPSIDGLLLTSYWSQFARTNFQFTIPDSEEDYEATRDGLIDDYPDESHTTIQPWSEFMKGGIRDTIAEFLRVLPFTITEQGDNDVDTQLRYGLADLSVEEPENTPPAYAWAPVTDEVSEQGNWRSGDMFFGLPDFAATPTWNHDGNPATPAIAFQEIIGTYQYATILHETGHALGLKHGHEADDGFPALPQAVDSMEFTVMTYRGYINDTVGGGYEVRAGHFAQTLMMLDIQALQYLYGADFRTRQTDTRYVWSPDGTYAVAEGPLVPPTTQWRTDTGVIFLTIWDGGGNDTYDFSAFTNASDATIDLAPGGFTNLGTNRAVLGPRTDPVPDILARGNVFNALQWQGDPRSLIENAIGGAGNDMMLGNAVGNRLAGGLGRDTLNGLGGSDTLVGQTGADSLNGGDGDDIALFADPIGERLTITRQGAGYLGNWRVDKEFESTGFMRLTNIEELRFGEGRDTISAGGLSTAQGYIFDGRGGDDALNGGVGRDTLFGGLGNDTLNPGLASFEVYGGMATIGGTGWVEGGAQQDMLVLDRSASLVGYRLTFATAPGQAVGAFTGRLPTGGESGYARGVSQLDYTGGVGGDTVGAGFGNATIRGAGGSDVLTGNFAQDRLDGGDAADTLRGAGGHDTLLGGAEADRLDGGEGNDSIGSGTGGDFAVFGGAGADTLAGSDDAETMDGGADPDRLFSGGGNDRLLAGSGADVVFGNAGNDTLFGEEGADSLDGEAGFDSLFGSEGDDTLAGGLGGDTLNGGAGFDAAEYAAIVGENVEIRPIGTDPALGRWAVAGPAEAGGDVLTGIEGFRFGDGADTVTARSTDTVFAFFFDGRQGNDILAGGVGRDTLIGGAGSDTLVPGAGVFEAYGGAVGLTGWDEGTGQDDLLVLDRSASAGYRLNFAPQFGFALGQFTSPVGSGGDGSTARGILRLAYTGGGGGDTVFGGLGASTLDGAGGNDVLRGNAVADVIQGGAGNDLLEGLGSADTLDGGAGQDAFDGGEGNDLIRTGGGGDINVFGSGGDDTLLGSDDQETLNGGLGDDSVSGLGGHDQLTGLDGADTLLGGDGNDSLRPELGADSVDGGAGIDRLDLFHSAMTTGVSHSLNGPVGSDGARSLRIEMLHYLGGSGGDTVRGAAGADTISGNLGNDVLDGLDGADQLSGGQGNDTLRGGTAIDGLSGGAGNDRIETGGGNDFSVNGEEGDDTILGSTGAEQVNGGVGNDSLFGAEAADMLIGGDGADTLRGGTGNDTLMPGEGVAVVFGDEGVDRLDLLRTASVLDVSFFLNGPAGNDGSRSSGIEIFRYLGGAGAETIAGADGADTLNGGGGNDRLSGNAGADILEGAGGNDTLSAGEGTDSLTGGAGADRMVIAPESGTDRLLDFDATPDGGQDLLDLVAFGFAGFAAMQAAGATLLQQGSDAWLTLGGGTTVVIFQQVATSVLDGSDFVFV